MRLGLSVESWGKNRGPSSNPLWWGIDPPLLLGAGEIRPWQLRIQDSAAVSPSRMIAQGDASRFGVEDSKRLEVKHAVGLFGFERDRISRRHSEKANVLFADGHVGSETLRQLLYPSLENWTRYNYDNQKHWRDSDMLSSSGWQPPTPLDETLGFLIFLRLRPLFPRSRLNLWTSRDSETIATEGFLKEANSTPPPLYDVEKSPAVCREISGNSKIPIKPPAI